MHREIIPDGSAHRRRVLGRTSAFGVVVTLALVVGQFAVWAPSAGAGSATCWVKNMTTYVTGSDLQAAIDAASPGDTLKVRGVCHGSFAIDRDLTLAGPATLDGETCDGQYCGQGIVLRVDAGNVSLRNLTITNGYSTYEGGGIWNYGTLTLRGCSSVTGNWAEDGAGGIYNLGTLTLNSFSSVNGNWLYYVGNGGGIWNVGTLILNGESSASGNSGAFGAGIYNDGTVILRGWASSVSGNSGDQGGGIFNRGTVSMRGGSSVSGNTAAEYGGGIFNDDGGVLTLRLSSSVTGNTAGSGGGIYDLGTVKFWPYWNGTVCGNDPDDWPGCQS